MEVVARFVAARGLAHAGSLQQAHVLLGQVTSDAPQYVPGLVMGALVAGDLGETSTALDCARRAAFLAPDAPYVLFVLADALQRAGHGQRAEGRYRWVRELLANLPADAELAHSGELTVAQLQGVLDGR